MIAWAWHRLGPGTWGMTREAPGWRLAPQGRRLSDSIDGKSPLAAGAQGGHDVVARRIVDDEDRVQPLERRRSVRIRSGAAPPEQDRLQPGFGRDAGDDPSEVRKGEHTQVLDAVPRHSLDLAPDGARDALENASGGEKMSRRQVLDVLAPGAR